MLQTCASLHPGSRFTEALTKSTFNKAWVRTLQKLVKRQVRKKQVWMGRIQIKKKKEEKFDRIKIGLINKLK